MCHLDDIRLPSPSLRWPAIVWPSDKKKFHPLRASLLAAASLARQFSTISRQPPSLFGAGVLLCWPPGQQNDDTRRRVDNRQKDGSKITRINHNQRRHWTASVCGGPTNASSAMVRAWARFARIRDSTASWAEQQAAEMALAAQLLLLLCSTVVDWQQGFKLCSLDALLLNGFY